MIYKLEKITLTPYYDKSDMQDMMRKNRGNKCKGSGVAHMAKLTEEDIPRIRDMLRCGAKQQDIGDWFRVSNSQISLIKNGKTWKHVA